MANKNQMIADGEDLQSLRLKRFHSVANVTYKFALTAHFIWTILFYFLEVYYLSIFNIFSVLCFVLCLYLAKKEQFLSAVMIGAVEIVIHQALAVYMVGWDAGFQYYLFPTVLLPFLTDSKNFTLKTLILFICLGAFLALKYLYADGPALYSVSNAWILFFTKFNVISALTLCGAIAYYFAYSVEVAEELAERERLRAENLLFNILPMSIAERLKLKKGDQTIADGFSNVSVLFLDLVGFTELSSRKSPEELVDILNRVFSEFDDLTHEYGLEKIKTIGDSYMVASGIPEYREDHAHKICAFSLRLNSILNKINTELGENLQMRIGINTGPVVAGVIGKKKFIYDLWGDAVNIASRMESHGIIGEIQLSDSTYELVKDEFQFEVRGEIEVKGKGMMKTYLLKTAPV